MRLEHTDPFAAFPLRSPPGARAGGAPALRAQQAARRVPARDPALPAHGRLQRADHPAHVPAHGPAGRRPPARGVVAPAAALPRHADELHGDGAAPEATRRPSAIFSERTIASTAPWSRSSRRRPPRPRANDPADPRRPGRGAHQRGRHRTSSGTASSSEARSSRTQPGTRSTNGSRPSSATCRPKRHPRRAERERVAGARGGGWGVVLLVSGGGAGRGGGGTGGGRGRGGGARGRGGGGPGRSGRVGGMAEGPRTRGAGEGGGGGGGGGGEGERGRTPRTRAGRRGGLDSEQEWEPPSWPT